MTIPSFICNKIGFRLGLCRECQNAPMCENSKDFYELARLETRLELLRIREAVLIEQPVSPDPEKFAEAEQQTDIGE